MDCNYPEPRGLDGIYSSVERDGRVVERCFSDLSKDEQDAFLSKLNTEELQTLCKELSDTVRGIAELFKFSCFWGDN